MKEEKIPETTIQQLREQLIGKTVSVTGQRYRGRDIGVIIGTCEYFGYNEVLEDWGLQITIDRMPLSNVSISQINIIEN